MATIMDNYSESNQSASRFIGGGVVAQGASQSFTGDGGVLDSAKWYLKKEASPTGNITAKIYAHSGTFGTSSVPTGSALATSNSYDISGLTTSYQLINFTFSGANRITLTNTTKYVITVEYSGGDASNYIVVGADGSSPTHAGNYSTLDGGTWSGGASTDFIFYVYKEDTESASPSLSASLSPSRSQSNTPSSSYSLSPSLSYSSSVSPSPLPTSGLYLKIAKTGFNALTSNDPHNFIFSSEYGTLKYFTKVSQIVQIDGSTGDFAGNYTYTHSLGYYPYAEVFVRVYIGSPSGNFEYCPFFGSGASVTYSANYKITTSTIVLYAEFNGVSTSVWNFDFLLFLYKNDLNL